LEADGPGVARLVFDSPNLEGGDLLLQFRF